MRVTRHRTTMALAASLALALSLTASCGDDDDGSDDDTTDASDGSDDDGTDDGTDDGEDAGPGDPDGGSTADCTPQSGTNLSLQPVLREGEPRFDQPMFVTSPPDDPRLFVVGKGGTISIVEDGRVQSPPFLDIEDRLEWTPGDERGLLGLAFHPDYARNGRFFVFYTRAAETTPNRLAEFRVSTDNPNLADPESERLIFEVDDPESNHNGGMIAFGNKDDYLYVGMGDGGGSNDQHGDIGNGQDKTTLLGDMLRIDVSSTDKAYTIPADNPYVGGGGDEREEIFISGVRNPWRWSFDRETGDLYIGDVGQDDWEEVDVLQPKQQSGANLGWNDMEGLECFPPGEKCDQKGLTLPVDVYPRDDETGAAVVGGYVYRGSCFPDIRGWYFYGDYVSEEIVKFVFAGGKVTEKETVFEAGNVLAGLSSFAEDAYGELYAVSMDDGEIYRITAGP